MQVRTPVILRRVLSIGGGGGAGGKLPPQSTQLLPQRRVARQKREREREGGGGERILFEIYVNSILLNYVKEYTCYT